MKLLRIVRFIYAFVYIPVSEHIKSTGPGTYVKPRAGHKKKEAGSKMSRPPYNKLRIYSAGSNTS